MKDFLPPPREARAAIAPLVGGAPDDEEVRSLYAAATWSFLVEPGDGIAGRLVGAAGAEGALREVLTGGRDGIARDACGVTADEWRRALERWRPRLEAEAIRAGLDRGRHSGMRLLTPDDPQWPSAVSDLGDHGPLVLWVRGDPAALTRTARALALVGARAATAYGEHVAMELAAGLVERGVTVVSGAAYGIDGAAHRAALAAGGTTVALLAGGADRPYPTGHTRLLEQIAASGAVVSEAPPGGAPTKWRFLQRNRLIAASSQATVIVEAGWRSGSLNTAGHAAALARPLGAVPGPVTSPASAGCHRVLREYDAHCITGVDDALELLGVDAGPLFARSKSSGSGDRTDDVTRVRDAMSFRAWRQAGDIARRSGLTAQDVSAILGLLSLDGEVVSGPDGWRRRRADASIDR